MAARSMKSTILETVRHWGVYQPDRRIDFNGFFWSRPEGGLLIDPMPLEADSLAELRDAGGAAWILVTNRDHWRASAELARTLGSRIAAPAADRGRFGAEAAAVDLWFEGEADLPAPLGEHLGLRWIAGGKSSREPVLVLRAEGALLFGDVVRSHVSGRLTLLPDAKLADRAQVVRDVRALADLEPNALLLGDGDSLFRGAAEEFRRFLDSLS